MKITRYIATFIAGFAALILLSIYQSIDAQPLPSLPQPPEFTGLYIAAIADGDLASTYHNGRLPAPNFATDTLSIINLPLQNQQTAITQIPASKSVTGAPYAIDISPDGTVFVVETLGAMLTGATRREQLPAGQQLVAINLTEVNNRECRL